MESDFFDVVERTKPVVLSAIHRFLKPEYTDNIDDIAQETYFRAYRALNKGQFQKKSKLETWLYTIAKNETIRMNQKLEKEKKKSQKMQMEYSLPDLTSNSVEHSESQEDLEKAISNLPEKYIPIVQAFQNGESLIQITKKLSLPYGTVKSRFFRAKEILSRSLRCKYETR